MVLQWRFKGQTHSLATGALELILRATIVDPRIQDREGNERLTAAGTARAAGGLASVEQRRHQSIASRDVSRVCLSVEQSSERASGEHRIAGPH